jgi:fructosamine-3-kinase
VIAVASEDGARNLVLKMTPYPGDTALQREYAVLRHFRARTALPVPEPFLLDLRGGRVPGSVLVMERIPGTALHAVYAHLGAAGRAAIATQIAEHLAALHAQREPGFGAVEAPPGQRTATWPEFWLPRYDAALAEAQAKGALPEALFAELQDLRRHLLPLLDIGPVGTLTHYDIWTGNVMVALDGPLPRVTGYLDALGYYGDYARELSSMLRLADHRLLHRYGRMHGFDPTFKTRFRLYALKMCTQLVTMYPDDPHHLANTRCYLRAVQHAIGRGRDRRGADIE